MRSTFVTVQQRVIVKSSRLSSRVMNGGYALVLKELPCQSRSNVVITLRWQLEISSAPLKGLAAFSVAQHVDASETNKGSITVT
ncbi:hypothetical protein ABVT39_003202 [Epinephelus coioides]